MKLIELFEKRSNPDKNQKEVSGHLAARAYLGNIDGDKRSNYGVSMTILPKLGINPGSTYNTPIGIYYYTADFYLDRLDSGDVLDFQHDAPYIQVFEINGNIMNISEMNHDQYNDNIRLLFKQVDTLSKITGKSPKEISDEIAGFIIEVSDHAIVNTYGGYFWYILWKLANYLTKGQTRNSKVDNSSSVIWNKIFRLLGWDAIQDDGSGIIHQNEPSQGVVINPQIIVHKKTFDNKLQDQDRPNEMPIWHKMMKLAKNHPVGYVIKQMTYFNNEYDNELLNTLPENKKIANKIFAKVYSELQKNPTLFDKIYQIDINFLLHLTDDKSAKRFLRMGSFISEWERTYAKKFKLFALALNTYEKNGSLQSKEGIRNMLHNLGADAQKYYNIMIVLQPEINNPAAKQIYNTIYPVITDYMKYTSEVS